jgi:glutamate decarboxylase
VIARARDPEKVDVTVLSQLLRARGWIIPAYTLPPNAEHITVLRMVIKENFSRDMVDLLAHDITSTIHVVEHGPSPRVKRALRRPMY